MAPEQSYLTIAQVVKRLREAGFREISGAAVRRWAHSGLIASKTLPNGRLYVPDRQVEALIAGEEGQPSGAGVTSHAS